MNDITPAQGLDADLDEHRRRILDVLARRLDQARRLAQLGQDAARAIGFGRVVEDRLGGQAERQRLAVGMRIPLPRSHFFELEDARVDVGRDDGVLDALGFRKALERNRVETARKAGERAEMRFDRGPAEVFEQVVVEMDAVHRGGGGTDLVQIIEVIVDEMRKRLGRSHVRFRCQVSGIRQVSGFRFQRAGIRCRAIRRPSCLVLPCIRLRVLRA